MKVQKSVNAILVGKKFNRKSALNVHIRTDHEKTKFFCDICGVSYTREFGLKIHIKTVHKRKKTEKIITKSVTEAKNNHKCDRCDKTFSRMDKLKIHINSVHEKVKHKCDICNQLFSRKDKVTRHKKTVHENQNLHECKISMWQRFFKIRQIEHAFTTCA